MDYNRPRFQILQTAVFGKWLSTLRDRIAQKHIIARLERLSLGHWGDCKVVGDEVVELRVHAGPGYRVYCWRQGDWVIVALGGGDKAT